MNKILLLLLLFSMKSFAQESAHSATYDTLYFSSSYGKVSAEYADIKRIIYEEDSETDRYVFKEYDKDGKLTMSGVTKGRNGRPDGMVTYYHENGGKKSEGYLEIRQKGIWKEWYQNGQLKETVEFGEDEARNFVSKLISYYDSLGNELINQGAGLFKEYYQNNIYGQLKTKGRYHNYNRVGEWEGFHTDGQLYYQESYSEEGEFVKGTSYDLEGNRFEYTELEMQPGPGRGMENLYRFIAKNIKYPKIAAKNGVQGRVYVQFVVNKDGSIAEVEVVKGISKECDEEAARVIKLMRKWSPGIQRGQPVRVRMIFPILFKLP